RGRVMLNLDSEDDRELFIGCAGGADVRIRWSRPRSPVPAEWVGLSLVLEKLRGGHSGAEIDKNRLNAIKGLARLLAEAGAGLPWRLSAVQGGARRNAIPRFATAEIWIDVAAETTFLGRLDSALAALSEQYSKLEPSMAFSARPVPRSDASAFG